MKKYTVDQITKGVGAYLDAEMLPLIQSDFKRVMVGAGISIAISKYAQYIPLLAEHQYLKPLEIIDSDGNVDLETLYTAIQGQMPKDGFTIDIPVVGAMRFKTGDIEKLYNTIRAQK